MASYKLPFTGPEVENRLNKVTDLEKNKANRSEIPSVPVQSVNGKIGDVTLSADDVKARPNTWTPSAADVGADSAGTASSAVTEHNTATDAHNDIRLWLSNVETWVKNLLDADDETLNQTSEMIQYMKDNRELIEQITTGKVSVTDIINNLTTNVANKPLSAAQGVILKGLIDALQTAVNGKAASADLTAHAGNSTVHITADERSAWNAKQDKATTLAGYGITDGAKESDLNAHIDDTTVHITVAERAAWNKNTTDIEGLSEEIADQQQTIEGLQPKGNYATADDIPNSEDVENWGFVKDNELQTAVKNLEDKIGQQNILWAEGDTLEEEKAWLVANGDKSLRYALSDGYYYKCVEQVTEGETVPNFTNLLDKATISLNKRYNSSDALKDATGYIAIDHLAVKSNDVIRINDLNVISASAGSNRVKYYNSSKSAITTYTGSDARADQLLKLTKSNGVMSWVVGYYNTTLGDDSTNTLPSIASNIAYMRANLYIGASTITEADIADLIITINEPIEYKTTEGKTELVWVKTDVPVTAGDYDDDIAELRATTSNHETRIKALEDKSTNASSGSILDSMTVFAPSPQLPADGSTTADFNSETITCKNIYDYIDALVAKYPKFLTKETLGKDQSGEFDWNRYTCCRRYYEAWQKKNYPKMYGWVNGSTTIYSTSVSPRIGDTLYTTAYIGTAKGTVSAVSNANQTRTVGGVVYTRDKSKDIEPTLIYSVMLTSKVGNSVYNSAKSKVTTISSITKDTLVGADGVTYTRYPLGDRNKDFVKPKVIVIGSNEHGRPQDPAEPAIISARMIKDLCECVNANNPFLNMLKNNYMVVFLPIINPWGYDNTHKSYYNSRGVNLDRNLDTPGWGGDTSNPQGEYGGSEAEMQYFMNTLVESGTKIVMANHALGTQLNASGEGANAGKCHYMLGRNNSKYNSDLLAIAESMLANYNLEFTDYGQAPPESYAKTRSYIDWIGAEGGAVEMQAREGYVLDGNAQLHTARILEADYTLHLQFLHMLIKNAQ